MKAQIFCLRSQKPAVGKIDSLLRRYIFESIEIERLEIGDDYGKHSSHKEHDHCRSFLSLFKASMIRVDDFAIAVGDVSGRWYYMGGIEKPYQLELFHTSMKSVFPAVAIMGRMVMMPHKVGDAFEKSRLFPWFAKPRDLEGVVLADFQHPDLIEDAIRLVADQLRADITKLCQRHMLFRNSKTPDFKELGQLLDVAPEYLEKHREDIILPSVNLSCSVVSGPIQLDADSEVALEVSYNSNEPLGRVCLYINAPFDVVENFIREVFEFPGGKYESRQVRFKIKPKTLPYCPLEALFTVDETRGVSAPFPIPLILDVQA
jgi:hypothetical protein